MVLRRGVVKGAREGTDVVVSRGVAKSVPEGTQTYWFHRRVEAVGDCRRRVVRFAGLCIFL